ncbi:MAG: hypothetical protein ACREK4_13495 [Candidatus Rokuibacteriota bacterium]
MRRLASVVSRLLIGMAATVLLLGALLFLLGLHLALVPLRVKQHRGLVLLLEIAERAAALAMLAKADGAGDENEPGARLPQDSAPVTQDAE